MLLIQIALLYRLDCIDFENHVSNAAYKFNWLRKSIKWLSRLIFRINCEPVIKCNHLQIQLHSKELNHRQQQFHSFGDSFPATLKLIDHD